MKKITKKIVASAIALALVVALTACGSCDYCDGSGEITEMYGVPLGMAVPCVMCD